MRRGSGEDGSTRPLEGTERALSDLERSIGRELPDVRSGAPEPILDGTAGEEEPELRPYLLATALAMAAMLLLVVTTSLPAAGVFQIGLTFLAVAMVVRRLQDLPDDTDNPFLVWLHERAERLQGKFGVEFYGIAALTAFLRAEADWVGGLSIGELLSNPIGTLISWFVPALIESIMNAVWSALWWMQLMLYIDGWPLFITVVVAGWAVWRVLDITPLDDDG